MDPNKELQALWIMVFGEPPFIRAEAELLIKVLVGSLPAAPPYEPVAHGVSARTGGGQPPPAFTFTPHGAMGRICVS